MALELAQAFGGLGAVLVIGGAWAVLMYRVRKVPADIAALVELMRKMDERIDGLEREFADLRGRVLERLRLELTPPRGTRVR